MNAPETYTSSDIRKLLGIPAGTLLYWKRSGLVIPSGFTDGGHARYTEADLRRLRLVAALTRANTSVQRVRKVLPVISDELEKIVADLER